MRLPDFAPRFRLRRVQELAKKFVEESGDDAKVERAGAKAAKRGYLTRAELLAFVRWKANGRSDHHAAKNDEPYVKAVSAAALRSSSERFRIEALTLLDGVDWPTASTVLHFVFPNRYPILDFRVLWSLRTDVPNQYSFPFWAKYVARSRELAARVNVNMRTLDRALWQYSTDHQRPS